MKKHQLLLFIISFFSFASASAQSAEKRLGIEINGGLNEYQGDLGSALFFAKKPNYQGVGGSISYYLNPLIDICIFGNGGDVGFQKINPVFPPEIKEHWFRTNLATVNGGLRIKLLKDNPFTPYIMLGAGGVYLHTKSSRSPDAYTGAAGNLAGGLGFQYRLNETFSLRLQSVINYTYNDIWDGEPFSYYTHTRIKLHDVYMYHSLGVCYNIPYGEAASGTGAKIKDKDKDGVPDKLDKCPKTKPWELPVNEEGCPKDSDLDTIPDYQDSCPYKFGPRKYNGCPDTDGDGILDKLDDCPDKKGSVEFKGCPDSDGDGVVDKLDECPTVKGLKEFNGCPDSDGDGIEDRKDKCPQKAGTAEGQGCPDSDGDGVTDNIDKCPTVAGTKENKGCPEVKKEVVDKIALAAKGIYFETGKDVIKPESFANLDILVSILNEYKESTVNVEGHTDNVGDPAKNLDLSQRRAEAVKAYLVSKGIDPARLNAVGYGDTKPIADNKTKDGKAKNRRVYFQLVY